MPWCIENHNQDLGSINVFRNNSISFCPSSKLERLVKSAKYGFWKIAIFVNPSNLSQLFTVVVEGPKDAGNWRIWLLRKLSSLSLVCWLHYGDVIMGTTFYSIKEEKYDDTVKDYRITPAGTRRNNNVIMTSKRRHDVVLTS